MTKLTNALRFLRNNGVAGFAKECYYRLGDAFYELYFNVKTMGGVGTSELGIADADARHYSSIFYRHTMRALEEVPMASRACTLLDYGCGKGRVLVAAASRQYRAIVGVEISDLCNTSRDNLRNMRHRRTSNITVMQADAREFVVPDDVNVIYFYNPFGGAILESVARRIHESYLRSPRRICIIYFRNDHFDRVVSSFDWLVKTRQSTLYPDIACGFYETRP